MSIKQPRRSLRSPLVSFIVLNFNGKNVITGCIESLIHQDFPTKRYEIIVVDNASSDGSAALIESQFHSVKVVRSSYNQGYAGGANLGASYSKGDVLAFVNNDTRLSSNWLATMAPLLNEAEGLAVIGSKIFLDSSMTTLNHVGGLISYVGGGFDIGFGQPDRTVASPVSIVGYVSGAALMIPRELFRRLGGFDASYFLYCEDVDLCWRAWLLGYKVVVQPAATLIHQYQSAQSGYWVRLFHWHKNTLSNILKNLEPSSLVMALILHGSLQMARVVSAIRWRSPWRIILMMKANFWVLRNLPSIMSKRAAVQASRTLSDRALLEKGVFLPLRTTLLMGRRMLSFRET